MSRPACLVTGSSSGIGAAIVRQSGREFTVAEIYGLMAEEGSQPIRRIGRPEDIAFAAYGFS